MQCFKVFQNPKTFLGNRGCISFCGLLTKSVGRPHYCSSNELNSCVPLIRKPATTLFTNANLNTNTNTNNKHKYKQPIQIQSTSNELHLLESQQTPFTIDGPFAFFQSKTFDRIISPLPSQVFLPFSASCFLIIIG